MRDIASPNGYSTLQTKSQRISIKTGTLTRADYRSYRDFVESYTDGKNPKDDQESVSSTDSGVSSYKLSDSRSNNTSTSSLNSEINGSTAKAPKSDGFTSRTGSFRNYLESYNNKKFSSVAAPKKSVKSEIVIQVNSPLESSKPVVSINGDEAREDLAITTPHQEAPSLKPTPPPPPHFPSPVANLAPPPPPPKLPDPSQPVGRKWAPVKTEEPRPSSTPSERPQANHAAAASLAKILTQHVLTKKRVPEVEPQGVAGDIPSPPTMPAPLDSARYGQNVMSVAPPPMPPSQRPKVSQNFAYVAPKPPQYPPSKAQSPLERVGSPKFAKPEYVAQKAVTVELPQHLPPRVANGRSSPSGVEFKTTTVVPVGEGAAKVSKSDPNVRKLVYNTYRGLLGAYNNKANDMIATLPRNMVREDQGISKQLESMALQGGLEKLNGRTNPNVEQE